MIECERLAHEAWNKEQEGKLRRLAAGVELGPRPGYYAFLDHARLPGMAGQHAGLHTLSAAVVAMLSGTQPILSAKGSTFSAEASKGQEVPLS